MSPEQLFQAGDLDAAIAALNVILRDRPADHQNRTFLFELLCFAGDYARADKQLDILEQQNADAATGGGALYHGALRAERARLEMFENGRFPGVPENARHVSGIVNGKQFDSIEDADPRIGPYLEVFAAGDYRLLPWQDIATLEMEPPKRLRNLLWAPAALQAAETSKEKEFGQVLLPVIAALSCRHPDGAVRLGRISDWSDAGDPVGQKLLLIDGEEIPFLEIRTLEILQPDTM
jgi:type VI secretion system protein ImpE